MNTENLKNKKILPSLEDNLSFIRSVAGNTSDLMVNEIEVCGIKIALMTCEGMVSTQIITELIFEPLTNLKLENPSPAALLSHIENRMLFSLDRPVAYNYHNFFRLLNSGFATIAADGQDRILAFGIQGYDKRSISEPSGENNITGAHDGFLEIIRSNMSLVRRRLKTPLLVQKLIAAGDKSQTDVCICYMYDRVPPELIERIEKLITGTNLETVLSTGYLRPFLEPKSKRLFNSVGRTERPDVLCSKLIEGRVGIFIDGNPFALVVPKLWSDDFQTVDDYNFRPYYSTFIRWLKYAAFLISILLPSLYVAIAMHHPELLNSTLLLILADAEQSAPFSIIAETVGVLLMYEIIKEAGLRLPKAVGGAVSIVGGLIIGDAAVTSGLISTPLLTVAALSVVSSFVVPDLAQPISVLRIVFIICGGIWGLFGISLFGAVVLFNMCATSDFGFPYTAPISPLHAKSMSDIAIREGFRKMQNNNFTVEELHE